MLTKLAFVKFVLGHAAYQEPKLGKIPAENGPVVARGLEGSGYSSVGRRKNMFLSWFWQIS